MAGHGWVIPNASGAVARCGGPGICRECQREKAQLESSGAVVTTPWEKLVAKGAIPQRTEWCRIYPTTAINRIVLELTRDMDAGRVPQECVDNLRAAIYRRDERFAEFPDREVTVVVKPERPQ